MRLTPRQTEVLTTYVELEDQQLAAEELGIKVQTVKNHLYSAYRELDATSILGAVKAMGWLRTGK